MHCLMIACEREEEDFLEFTRWYYNALHCRDYLLGRLFSADY